MGEDSYDDLTNGQKALVNAYRASQLQSVQERKSHAYRDCKVNLYDTFGKFCQMVNIKNVKPIFNVTDKKYI